MADDAPSSLQHFIYNRLRMRWSDFVESLGIPCLDIRKRLDWTKRKLLAQIRRWKAEGHRVNCGDVKLE